MARPQTAPEGSIRLETYLELDQFVTAFAEGHINLLILLGGAGLAKSQTIRRAIGDVAGYVEGNASAYGLYVKAYQCRDQPLVIDDVDSLYADKAGVRLLKCLAQTDPVKRMAWHTASISMKAEGIPKEFETRSRAIIIANDWRTLNANVSAVQDRGHVVLFAPTAAEVHRRVGEWFDDDEIYAWFERHLSVITSPSMRHYLRARELKLAGLDWQTMIGGQFLPPKLLLVAKLKDDPQYTTEAERVEAFKLLGGGSRATYFNQAKKLRAA